MALTEKDLPKIQFNKQPDNFGSRMVGEVYQQMGPFEWKTHDWNNDGDVYDEKVAKFQKLTDVNPHSPNYFSLTEWEFRDLKNSGCIAYVKEQAKHALPLLDDILSDAEKRKTRPGGPGGPGDGEMGKEPPKSKPSPSR